LELGQCLVLEGALALLEDLLFEGGDGAQLILEFRLGDAKLPTNVSYYFTNRDAGGSPGQFRSGSVI
jgi:hypothetical protein